MKIRLFGATINIKEEYAVIFIVIIIAIIATVGTILKSMGDGIVFNAAADVEKGIGFNVEANTVNEKEETKPVDQISVYVTGAVLNPGVITINRGQIINDAIVACGGATKDADIENINLAYKLNYNVMLKIRSIDEEYKIVGSNNAEDGALIIENSGGALVEDKDKTGKININTATIDDLTKISGIGPAYAEKIVIYRDMSGPFVVIEDIMKVSGIKDGIFNSVKDYIRTD